MDFGYVRVSSKDQNPAMNVLRCRKNKKKPLEIENHTVFHREGIISNGIPFAIRISAESRAVLWILDM